MKQAVGMQEQLVEAQNALSTKEFEGSAGGGVVMAVVTGGGELVSITNGPSVIDPTDAEMLSDLVVAAVNQATNAATDAASDQMGSLTCGMDLGGLGLGNPLG
jgi:hypothetical protein